MPTFKIFQINLSDEFSRRLNAGNPTAKRVYKKYIETISFPTVETIIDAIFMYRLVAKIKAENLEDVFRIGNIGPERNITRFGRMHSISVGDVIVENYNAYFVDSFGFKMVPDFIEALEWLEIPIDKLEN